jgi:hypothetical protein
MQSFSLLRIFTCFMNHANVIIVLVRNLIRLDKWREANEGAETHLFNTRDITADTFFLTYVPARPAMPMKY